MNRREMTKLRRQLTNEAAVIETKIETYAKNAPSMEDVKGDQIDEADALNRASMIIRMSERERKYLNKIRKALVRIDEGDYGDCEECEEPIGLKRLEIRPVTTLCVECKEAQEHREGIYARL